MSLFSKRFRMVLGPLLGCLGLLVLFFSVTDPTTWPQRTTRLSSSDMRIAPPMSTIWCESVVLLSEHDFVAYKMAKAPAVATKLSRSAVELEADLDSRKLGVLELRYYLLGGSVISVDACASQARTHVRLFEGKASRGCARKAPPEGDSSEGDSSEEEHLDASGRNASQKVEEQLDCPSPLRFREIPTTLVEGLPCPRGLPLSTVVDNSGDYTVFFSSESPVPSRIKLRLTLDRTTYNVNESRRSLHLCTAGSLCVVPLSFASADRIILWIPAEPAAGRSQFSIHSRCRPRIEFFAVLTILLPIALMFSVVCIVVRSKEARLHNMYSACNGSYQDRAAPLLVGFRDVQAEGHVEAGLGRRDSDPPSYDTVLSQTPPPPPYSSLKLG